MEIHIARKHKQYTCTMTDNGHIVGTTRGATVSEAKHWMRQLLTRVYNQGLELLGAPPLADPPAVDADKEALSNPPSNDLHNTHKGS